MEPKKCVNCHADIPQDSSYCPFCGAAASPSGAAAPENNNGYASQQAAYQAAPPQGEYRSPAAGAGQSGAPGGYASQPPYGAQPGQPGPQPPYGNSAAWGAPPPYGQQQQPPYGAPPQPGQPPYNGYYPAQKSKLAAGLLGIFLGGLGIHNFYLGYQKKALVQLLVSVIGGVLTFSLAAWAMWIWGLVEGIQILSGSVTTDAFGVPLKD